MVSLVGSPDSPDGTENGMFVYCGLNTLTPASDPPPLNPPGNASEFRPRYLSIEDLSLSYSKPASAEIGRASCREIEELLVRAVGMKVRASKSLRMQVD